MKLVNLEHSYIRGDIEKIFTNNLRGLNLDYNKSFTNKKVSHMIDWTMDHILYALFSEESPYDVSNYDFVIGEKLMNFMNKSPLKFFTNKNKKFLRRKYSKGFSVNVDSDYYGYIKKYLNENKLNKDIVIYCGQTLPSFLSFSNKMEKVFNLDDSYDSYSLEKLYEEYEILIKKSISNIKLIYQFGGNTIRDIQLRGTDLIGYYAGGYGDSGALYIEKFKDSLYARVDMN